jgi:hypothetical protein
VSEKVRRKEHSPKHKRHHKLIKEVRSTGSLLYKTPVRKRHNEETFDERAARLEHTPQKSLRRLAQDTGISKSSAAVATNLLKLRPDKATVVHALQPHDPARRTDGQDLQNEPPRRRRVKRNIRREIWKSLRKNFFG